MRIECREWGHTDARVREVDEDRIDAAALRGERLRPRRGPVAELVHDHDGRRPGA